MLGYTAGELSALTLYDFAPDDRPSVDANVHRIADQRSLTIPNRAFRRKDGKEVTVEVDAVLIDEDGRQTVFNVVHSLAERRALEEQLRQAQKMEAVGRLAGGIAHDFNNLLTAILGYAELLLDSELSGDVKNSVDEIRKAGDRAAALTKQLLAFSRKQLLQPKVLDLNEVLAEVDGMLRRTLGEDVTYEAERDPHLWRGSGRSGPGPAGAPQSGGERARRDARGRRPQNRDPERDASCREPSGGSERRRRGLRAARGRGHRPRDERRRRFPAPSSLSSRRRREARAPASVCRRSTGSSSRAAATSTSKASPGKERACSST